MTSVPEFFLQNWWAGPALWAALFCSDYYLTLICARMYRAGICEKIVFQGSYELTPIYQKDIDSLRRFSPRFVAVLVAMVGILGSLWLLTAKDNPALYAAVLGIFVFIQLTVHMRHVRNYFTFRGAATDAVRGRIEYSRPLMLRQSAIELAEFAALYAVIFAFTKSWFVLGGVFGCSLVAYKHNQLAKAHETGAGRGASPLEVDGAVAASTIGPFTRGALLVLAVLVVLFGLWLCLLEPQELDLGGVPVLIGIALLLLVLLQHRRTRKSLQGADGQSSTPPSAHQ